MFRATVFVASVLCVSAAIGDDFLLTVETRGYSEVPATEKNPKTKRMYSVEVLVSPGKPFRSRTKFGENTITIAGVVNEAAGGKYSVTADYSCYIDKGRPWTGPDGVSYPTIAKTKETRTMVLSLGEPEISSGNTSTQRQGKGKPDLISRSEISWKLSEYKPDGGEENQLPNGIPSGPSRSNHAQPAESR